MMQIESYEKRSEDIFGNFTGSSKFFNDYTQKSAKILFLGCVTRLWAWGGIYLQDICTCTVSSKRLSPECEMENRPNRS